MKPVPISTARKDFFQLFEKAVRHDGQKIVISRRGVQQRAVLVSAEYVERLERQAQSPARPLSNAQVAKLLARRRGTMTIVGDPDTVLSEVRARQNALAAAKMDRIFGPARRHASV